MKLKIVGIAILCLFGLTSLSTAVDFKPGMWEHTVKMEIPGMPFTPPPSTTKSCMTKDKTVPGSANRGKQKCSDPETSIKGNTVSWKLTCNGDGGKSVSEGSITYSGKTYKGEATVTTQGKKMISKMSGRYLGPCK